MVLKALQSWAIIERKRGFRQFWEAHVVDSHNCSDEGNDNNNDNDNCNGNNNTNTNTNNNNKGLNEEVPLLIYMVVDAV